MGMKKHLLVFVLAFSVLLPTTLLAQSPADIDPNPTASSCVSLNNNLRYQSRDVNTGDEVSTMQDFLQSQGYLNSEPTGYFGLLTLAAAKSFQSTNGISPTGYVGPITRAKIKSLTCGTATTPPVSGGSGSGGGPGVPSGTPATSPATPSTVYGCRPGFLFSPLTGQSCATPPTTSFPPGCTSNQGYSTTTGKSCGSTPIPLPTATYIEVTSPNGGETWTQGTTQTIKWKDTGGATCPTGAYCSTFFAPQYYDITLQSYYPPCTTSPCPMSTMAYPAPYTIAKNVKDTSYQWLVGTYIDPSANIPNSGASAPIPDGAYVVLVCQTGATNCDSSDSYFKIVTLPIPTPTLSITTSSPLPNGKVGQVYGGSISATGGTGAYGWSVVSGSLPPGLRLSPAPCGTPCQPPVFLTGTPTTAGTYTFTIGLGIGTPGSFTFTTNKQFTLTVDSAITSPSITVLSPNGGETWAQGTTQTIKWKDTGGATCPAGAYCSTLLAPQQYDITLQPEYSCPSLTVCLAAMPAPYTITTNTAGSVYPDGIRTIGWIVGSVLGINGTGNNTAPDGAYYIEVCRTGTTICDSSDSYFKIVTSPIPTPTLSITTSSPLPNAKVGQPYSVSFYQSGLTEPSVGSSFFISGGYFPPGISFALDVLRCNTMACVGTIGGTPTTAGQYTFTLKLTEGSRSVSKTFALNVEVATQLSVTVLAPSGGDMIRGVTDVISWDATPSSGRKYNIELVPDRVVVGGVGAYVIANNVSSHSYSWTVGNYLAGSVPDGAYKIRVYDTEVDSNGTVRAIDMSDASFRIITPPTPVPTPTPAPFITVLNPNGGDQWNVGSTYGIIWNSSSSFTTTYIYLSGGGNAEGYSKQIAQIPDPSKTKLSSGSYYYNYTPTIYDMAASAGYTWKVAVCEEPMNYGATNCGFSEAIYITNGFGQVQTTSNVLGVSTYHFTQELMLGSTGTEVTELQKYLAGHGYSVGPIDGIFGANLNRAVVEFQTTNNIWADGIVGPETRAVLNK